MSESLDTRHDFDTAVLDSKLARARNGVREVSSQCESIIVNLSQLSIGVGSSEVT